MAGGRDGERRVTRTGGVRGRIAAQREKVAGWETTARGKRAGRTRHD